MLHCGMSDGGAGASACDAIDGRMFKALIPLAAALFLAAPLAAQEDPPLDPNCPQGDLAAARGPGSVCIGRLTDDYAFSVVYPREAAAIPRLDALLRDEALRAEVRFEATVNEFRGQAGKDAPRLSYEQAWRVDALLPELIALSSTTGVYTGGAHGGISYRSILFDRRRNRPIALADVFTVGAFEYDFLGQRPVGEGAMQRAFCRVLREAVRERRDDPAARVDCPEVMLQPITLVCGENNRIEAMRALVAPYVVGSWAEGPYEVDFPIDAMMMAAVRRHFRPAFAVPGENRPRRVAEPCR
jgi:hypothetical protein